MHNMYQKVHKIILLRIVVILQLVKVDRGVIIISYLTALYKKIGPPNNMHMKLTNRYIYKETFLGELFLLQKTLLGKR